MSNKDDYIQRIGERGCGWGNSMATGAAQGVGREHYRSREVLVIHDMERWLEETSEANIEWHRQEALIVDVEQAKNDPVTAITIIFALATEAAKIAYNQDTLLIEWEAKAKKRREEGRGLGLIIRECIERYSLPHEDATKIYAVINEIASHWMANHHGAFDDLWLAGGVPNLEHPVQKDLWEGKFHE